MKVTITCGGTGGHIYPALAVARSFKKNEVTFIGTSERMENRLIPQEGFTFTPITTSRNNPIKIATGFIQALLLLIKDKPQCILSTGGWVTLPVCLAGVLLRIPIILQEQNTIPGKVNRLIGHWAKYICLGFPTHGDYFNPKKTILTGNPVRPEFLTIRTQQTTDKSTYRIILIIGGSQGASILNQTITDLFKDGVLFNIKFILLTGDKTFKSTINNLKSIENTQIIKDQDDLLHLKTNRLEIMAKPYANNIPELLTTADMIIARSGASTLSELAAVGKPSILIPYPHAADNHQYWNAHLFSEKNAARIINNDELSPASLKAIINQILSEANLLKTMGRNARMLHQENAAETIANLINNATVHR